jgi:hypothetical protein
VKCIDDGCQCQKDSKGNYCRWSGTRCIGYDFEGIVRDCAIS